MEQLPWATPSPGSAPAPPQVPGAYAAPAVVRSADGRQRRGVVPLRPLGVGELLDGSVAVVRAYPRPVFAMSAAVAAVSGVLQLVLALTVLRPLAEADLSTLGRSSEAVRGYVGGAALGVGLALLVATVTGAVLAGVVTVVASRAVFGSPITVREALAQVRPRLGRLVATALVVGLVGAVAVGAGVGLALLLGRLAGPPGYGIGALVVLAAAALAVLLTVRWSLAPVVVVLERSGVRPALRRSAVLVRGSFWRVLGILVLAAVVAGFVGQIVQIPLRLLGGSPLPDLGGGPQQVTTRGTVVAAVAAMLSATLVAPFPAGVRALLYVDRRMRAEGMDIALVAAAAPGTAPR